VRGDHRWENEEGRNGKRMVVRAMTQRKATMTARLSVPPSFSASVKDSSCETLPMSMVSLCQTQDEDPTRLVRVNVYSHCYGQPQMEQWLREQVRFEGDSAAGGKRARDESREPGRYMRRKCCMLSAHLMLLLIHFSFSLADKLP
jgi:hypothetical protein